MEQGDRGTVHWRAAFELFERWQTAPPDARPAVLARLAEEQPELAAALQALVRADAAATRDPHDLSLVLPDSDRAGAVIGAWRLERLLGSGGMGEVWLAHRSDALHQGQAAIKLLQAHQRSPVAQARFAAEARLLARLAHPHIARLLDVGIDASGQRHLVLEYVAGEPINRWCAARDSSLAERLRLFLQVCDAVAHAHAHLVVHRDLKPSNILVDGDGQAKLLDFGVAKLLDDSEEALTCTGLTALTPEYAAPEQLLGEPVTVATDVYALGVVLFELLSGERPFLWAKSSPLERLRDVLETEPRQLSRAGPSTRAPQLRGDLDHIVAHALQREPRDRYLSVRALANDVQRHLDHQPVQATAPTWRYRAGKFVRRHRAGVAAASVVTLALLGGTAAALWQAGRAQDAAREARAEAAKANATREFLLDLFRSVGMGSATARAQLERPVRELVVDAGQRLLDDRQLPPDVKLDLLRTIGRLHARLSLLDSADRMDLEALALARRLHGPQSETALGAAADRVRLLRQLGRSGEAMALGTEVIETTRRLGRSDSLVHVLTLHELGDAAIHADDPRALDYLRRAVDGFARHYPRHPERVYVHIALMRVYRRADDFPAFDREHDRINTLIRQGEVDPDFDRFYLERTVASRWLATGDYARARETLAAVLPLAIESHGPRHPMVVLTQRRLAALEHQLGDRVAARRQLAALDQLPQDMAVWSAGARNRVFADLAWGEGDLPAARAGLLVELSASLGDLDAQTLALVQLARVESLLGHHDTALAGARAAVDYFGQRPGRDSLLHAQALAAWAEALQAAGRWAEAGPAFEDLLTWADGRIAAPAGPLVGRLRARALIGLSAHHRVGDPGAALHLALQAQAGRSARDAVLDDRLLWAAAHVAQAQALKAAGRHRQASAVAAEAVDPLTRDQVAQSPRLRQARMLARG